MTVSFRPAEPNDTPELFDIMLESFNDLSERSGLPVITGGDDPKVMKTLWQKRRSLFEHLEKTAAYSWVADNDGKLLGYARSIERDGVLELTEFFVRPGEQSAGIGRELLAHAFPIEDDPLRVIIATTDDRAQARYLKTGTYPRFPIRYFKRKAEPVTIESPLEIETVQASAPVLEALDAIDRDVLGHARRADHAWLLGERRGTLYYADGEVIGYGYLGEQSGPFALRDAQFFPAVLAHAETSALDHGEDFGVELPLINKQAVDYLLGRGYRMDPFVAFFMSDKPFGSFERYIFTSPPFFL